LSPNFWLFFVASKKDFGLIHRLKEGLSTVWWKSSLFTRLREWPSAANSLKRTNKPGSLY
jgi:hypothetical protein